jgi:para-nitrobenzyl esterase
MSNDKQVMVTLKSGKLEGYIDNGLYVFKGIPYAAPPVGKLRWMPPQPPEKWNGVRQAKEFGPIAPQSPMPAGVIPQVPQPQSEDCLLLNIWTRGLDNAKRPVMVWIHGGAFTIGSGSDAMYDSDKLPRNGDIVLVSINYRLGMLGFLRLKDATNGKIPATGNEGLMDQVAALKWVKENIAAFGGDSNNITVFGESAGGMSIGCLMAMPSAKGLFQKAILESGVGSTAVPLKESNAGGEQFLKVAGINKDNVDAYRALTPGQLLEIEAKMRTMGAGPGEAQKITATTPVIDGEIILDVPNEMARKGYSRDIVTIIGTNLEEWKLFGLMQPGYNQIDEAEVIKRIALLVPAESAKKLVETYKKARAKRGDAITPPELLSAIDTDIMFRMPALELVEAQQKNEQRVYNYLFNWKSPAMGGAFGACHALEIGFVFGKYDDMFCGTGPEADKLANQMQDAWLAFARTGSPSCKSLGDWPVYGKERMTMMLGKDSHVEAAPYEEERSVWDTVKRQSYLVI